MFSARNTEGENSKRVIPQIEELVDLVKVMELVKSTIWPVILPKPFKHIVAHFLLNVGQDELKVN